MAITPDYSEYVDDRDDSVREHLRSNDPRTSTEWFRVKRLSSDGVEQSYVFSKANYNSAKKLMAKQDAEWNAWMMGVDQ